MAPIALLSVSNKQGLLPFARTLIKDFGYELISSGGTASTLEADGLQVKRVADYTGAPEILGGRVKTLHPRIHGGILAIRDNKDHDDDLREEKISQIDLVVVNLYPFQEKIKDPNISYETAIENIDIGGPAMIRAAAKNHAHVTVLTRPDQYETFIQLLKDKENKNKIKALRQKFALEAFQHTAIYDVAISRWMNKQVNIEASHFLSSLPLKQSLRYGENPHQKAAWYSLKEAGWGGAIQLQGKELSTNNLLDLESALSTILEFGYGQNGTRPCNKPAAVIIKHTNPCGVAISDSIEEAILKALDADKISSFGGIVALNQLVNKEAAIPLTSLFLECIIAPSFSKEARDILSKKTNLRLIELPTNCIDKAENIQIRSILGGILVQDLDNQQTDKKNWKVATNKIPTASQKEDLDFAWKLVKHVRSNAIVIAANGQSLGIGAGQMNRIGSAQIAISSAKEKVKGAVLASDGFFPFDDTVYLAAKSGISAIIQPGGSIRDKESIDACNKLGISMILTGKRHFLH